MATIVRVEGRGHRVTGWPGRARRANLGSRLIAGRIQMPSSHQLTKVLGEALNISWGVSNTGGSVGAARLWLFAVGNGGLVVESTLVQIQAGGSATLSLSWPSTLPSGTHSMLVIMADQSPGATPSTPSVSEHAFTVVVAATGPKLAAGTLSIS